MTNAQSLRFAARRIDITPRRPVSLLGYFNERLSEGVLDPLYSRLALFHLGDKRLLFVQIDTCLILNEDAARLKKAIFGRTGLRPEDILVFASHTHSAPALAAFFETKKEETYLDALIERIADEAAGLEALEAVRIRGARAAFSGLSHNRRWFLKDGSVVTNPPKGSPLLARPEGAVDRELQTIAVFSEGGDCRALFANLSNHTDTIGGNMISGDWPGFMERRLNDALKSSAPVFTLLAPQGNINHFEFENPEAQTGYREAERIGGAYAELVHSSLRGAREIEVPNIESAVTEVDVPPREVSDEELRRAHETARALPAPEFRKDLTAEDLAKGDPSVDRIFALALRDFAAGRPASYRVSLQLFTLGGVAFCAIPGEPFAEVGLELKKSAGYEMVVPVALANGYYGYIPLRESFERGGYEVRPSLHNCLGRDAAGIMIEAFKRMLRR